MECMGSDLSLYTCDILIIKVKYQKLFTIFRWFLCSSIPFRMKWTKQQVHPPMLRWHTSILVISISHLMKVFKTLPPYPTPVPSPPGRTKKTSMYVFNYLFELYEKKILKTFLKLLYVPLKKECHVVLKQVNISKYNFGWSVPLTKKQQQKKTVACQIASHTASTSYQSCSSSWYTSCSQDTSRSR